VEWELEASERDRYAKDGFFVREAVFGEADLARLRDAAERVVARAARAAEDKAAAIERSSAPADDAYRIDGNRYVEAADATVQYEHEADSRTIRVIEPFHHLDPVFEDLVADPRIVVPLCGVLESDRIALWTDKINLKRPREGSGFRWHQDSPYWSHVCDHCDRLPNVMITLDDADRDNGCFRLVPGSHREGFLPGLDDGTRLGPLFTDPEAFDEGAQWLAEGVAELDDEQAVARLNAEDRERFAADWDAFVAAAVPGRTIALDDITGNFSGGVLLRSADDTVRVDNSFEGRMERYQDHINQAIADALFPASVISEAQTND
jgi:ectoine hydroxylase-related dioxygenase (phytanoyl-CoA dioxygenase family)